MYRSNIDPLPLMGRGIPAPTLSDTGQDVGALPPIPSGHSPVKATDARLTAGRRTTSHAALNTTGGGWGAAHKCAW
uniref:Uncharacterized protein n=1 Tax=Oryza sativa subsp. japonica TaxID=39947 RepID=Q8H4H4_ORYSJ|nr:hypothetical protein [Oryza sativa Japonica Group]